jgi:hypothetical protein
MLVIMAHHVMWNKPALTISFSLFGIELSDCSRLNQFLDFGGISISLL